MTWCVKGIWQSELALLALLVSASAPCASLAQSLSLSLTIVMLFALNVLKLHLESLLVELFFTDVNSPASAIRCEVGLSTLSSRKKLHIVQTVCKCFLFPCLSISLSVVFHTQLLPPHSIYLLFSTETSSSKIIFCSLISQQCST